MINYKYHTSYELDRTFFHGKKKQKRVQAVYNAVNRGAAYVMRSARGSIRKGNQFITKYNKDEQTGVVTKETKARPKYLRRPSKPKKPPKYWDSQKTFKRIMFHTSRITYGLNISSAIVGHEKLTSKKPPIPRLHEFGGTAHRTRYKVFTKLSKHKRRFGRKGQKLVRPRRVKIRYRKKVSGPAKYPERPYMTPALKKAIDRKKIIGVFAGVFKG